MPVKCWFVVDKSGRDVRNATIRHWLLSGLLSDGACRSAWRQIAEAGKESQRVRVSQEGQRLIGPRVAGVPLQRHGIDDGRVGGRRKGSNKHRKLIAVEVGFETHGRPNLSLINQNNGRRGTF